MTKRSIVDGAVEYIPRKTKEGKPVVAQFYRSLKGQYNEGEWVSENTVQSAMRKLNVREGAEAEQQKQVFNKYFSQIKTD